MKNFVQDGDTIPFIAGSALLSGAALLLGSIFGVVAYDVASGGEGEMKTSGVFDLPKTTGQAWTVGQLLYWSGTAVTSIASTNKAIGCAFAAAASGDTVGRVRLNGAAITA